MANYSNVILYVPDLNKPFVSGNYNYSDPSVKKANTEMINRVNTNYGNIINYWSKIFEVPSSVIISFICTESGGKMAKPNKYLATGLMQVTPNAIWECARKWGVEVKTVPLPTEAKTLITSNIPNFFDKNSKTVPTNKILILLEKDANFNVMAGTLCLRWLLERFGTIQTGGQLNKAMVGYNAGAYHPSINANNSTKKIVDTTSLVNNSKVPKESRGYLYKMLGVDGFLSIIYKG